MKTWIAFLALAVVAGVVAVNGAAEPAAKTDAPEVVRHVVLFKFKDTATPAQIKTVEDAFRALPGKIPQIQEFEWGTNISPESHSQGYTHCFFLTFKNAADRDAYLPHPAHKEFGKALGPYLDKVCVIDYAAKK